MRISRIFGRVQLGAHFTNHLFKYAIMTLSFSTQLAGKPPHFVEKIWTAFNLGEGESQLEFNERQEWLKKCIYSFNLDPLLLAEVGIKIHTIRADPKNRWRVGMPIHFVVNNRTPQRFQFAPILPVKAIQQIKIRWCQNHERMNVYIDGVSLESSEIKTLSKNDGFEHIRDFGEYFNSDFDGKIIHWTDFVYSFSRLDV